MVVVTWHFPEAFVMSEGPDARPSRKLRTPNSLSEVAYLTMPAEILQEQGCSVGVRSHLSREKPSTF
eukprot:4860632-Pyramimonas_sp.AAC.1